MGSTFNPQILVDKLSKLNNTQASIETLSHWCIFHMNKARQVVDTWDRQFHSSPRDQRLAFLYLANDILQNSRRKGSEFVAEFWKVLPGALRDVIHHGDEFAKNAALRLIGIWEERKVFGSRGQSLREELVGKYVDNNNRNEKHAGLKPLPSVGSTLDKIVSSYQVVYNVHMDEDNTLTKCRDAINCMEKANKEVDADVHSGQFHGAAVLQELQGQQAILRSSIEKLASIESSRANLVFCLKEALQEQESKLEQVRTQLQAARSHSEQADNIRQHPLNSSNAQSVPEHISKEANTHVAPQSFISGDRDQSATAMQSHVEEDPRKSAAAAMAEKLTASSSSAQMLSYVLSSLASEGVISNSIKESPGDQNPEKRARLDNGQPYVPNDPPPPPPSSPPPPPPQPPMGPYTMPQFVNGVPFSYQQLPPSLPGYMPVGTSMAGIVPYTLPPPGSSYQSYSGTEAAVYSQQLSSMPMTPVPRP